MLPLFPMAFILASYLRFCGRDEDDDRWAIAIENKNSILSNIKKYTPKTESVVTVANDPADYDRNDEISDILFDSLEMSGLKFKTTIVLDNRNKKHAKEIIENADLVILLGGEIVGQIKFFEKIKLEKWLQNHKGLTIGISAGAMNLCKDIYNFPEEISELNQKRWIKGLGFYSGPFIPHFDGKRKEYQNSDGELDIVGGYILPASKKKEFIGQPNDSYIVINGDKVKYYGTHYIIKNGKVEKLQHQRAGQ